ncbi:unnamed protein product [Miscanthus lutarioriparius]|uniref:Uncharacterized protein n=1 Tax=Miscanthus lutarioriparius TaxID=422564 RepID=A0A811R346_9POAL|nr:unnamed protein product [Miscanthus lutarioriparius]
MGASAVLRAVAQRLTPGSLEAHGEMQFDLVIHIDCSKWESRRALQRAIAEQLDLPARVMELLDWQDEESHEAQCNITQSPPIIFSFKEDDLHGVKQDSRVEIPRVLEAMYDHIHKVNHRFLIIFQNGSSEEINLSIFGFPLSGYSRNKVLWTFQGRFRLFPRLKVDGAMTITKATDVFLSASQHEKDKQELRSYLVHQEAVESAPRNQPSQVAEYFLYMWNLCCMSYHFRVDYDFNTHCCNFWICDGILQHQVRQQRFMQRDTTLKNPCRGIQRCNF